MDICSRKQEFIWKHFHIQKGFPFPLTVGKDEYFVLGDYRTDAKDSRIYGTVKKEEIKGTVITLLRHRGF